MHPKRGSPNFVGASTTQPQIYSPARSNYQNRVFNTTETNRNKNRAQQIVSLHQEFEELKKKIKQVQNKNQKIIQKIHRQCNFKKKNPQTFDVSGQNTTSPIIYYQKKDRSQMSQASGMSFDQSNKSDQSQYEFKQKRTNQRKSVQIQRKVGRINQMNDYNKSIQYSRQQLKMKKQDKSKISNSRYNVNRLSSQQKIQDQQYLRNENEIIQIPASQTFHHLKDYGKKSVQQSTPYSAQSQTLMGFSNFTQIKKPHNQITIYQLEQSLKIQKQKTLFLQQQLKSKQVQILNFKKSYNKLLTQNENFAMILQDELQNFMENIVKKGMFQIQKNLKRQQNKIKNLIINIKDSYEEHKSSKIIKEHQLRRSNSRSKKDVSPAHNTSIHSAITPLSGLSKIPRSGSSQSSANIQPHNTQLNKQIKPKMLQINAKKNKDFQQIVQKYEELIGAKKVQISKLQLTISTLNQKNQSLLSQINEKDKQVKQMKIKIDQLQKLISQTQCQMPILKNQINIVSQKNRRRQSSNQSNLLEDIQNFQQQQKIKNNQFQNKYLQVKQELEKNKQIINQFQKKTKNLQKQIKSLNDKKNILNSQNNNNLNSQKIQKQKIQESIRKQLDQYYTKQIKQKQQKNHDLQLKINNLQRKLVQKDCEIITLQNKIKKNQSQNQVNSKKIFQYQKLLNQYNQNNTSVDYQNGQFNAFLLDKSICNDDTATKQNDLYSSRRNTSDKPKNILIQISQLENYQKKLQNLNQQVLLLTKKIKILQNSQRQKNYQIQKIKQQLQKVILQKQKLNRQKNILQEKVQQYQKERQQENSNDFSEQLQNDKNNRQNSVYSNIQKSQTAKNIRKFQSISNTQDIYSSDMKNRKTLHVNNSQPAAHQQSQKRLHQQILILKSKNSQLLKTISNIKQEHLQLSRQNITLKKNNQYLQDTLSDRQSKYQKYRRETEQLKIINAQINQNIKKKEQQLKRERQQNCEKIIELQKQWNQFSQQMNKNNENQQNKNLQNSQLLRTSRYNMSQSSVLYSSALHNKTSQYLQQQNQFLSIKLKQAEATIESQSLMEEKILNQYKKNVQKLKIQIKQKNKQIQYLKKQNQLANDKIRRLELINKSMENNEKKIEKNSKFKYKQNNQKNNIRKNSTSSSKKNTKIQQQKDEQLMIQEFDSYNEDFNNLSVNSQKPNDEQDQILYPYQKIIELQVQLKKSKDLNEKLQQMQESLFKQIKFKQQQKHELLKILEQKSMMIQELQEIIELKQINLLHSSHIGSNIIGSHISSSNHKSSAKNLYNSVSQRQSMRSQSSLRYSGISHCRLAPHELNQIHQSNLRTTQQRFQIQLTQNGSQLLDRSYLTNISEFFQRDQFPLEKAQLKRNQQIKFFQKTASYIKSLKQTINQKNKKIVILQKKIESLKQNYHGHISKQLQTKYQVSTGIKDRDNEIEIEFEDVYKDYESVQLERKKNNYREMCKSLKHQIKLSIQENNVLSIQIQALKLQIQKAQQQQDNLVMMKDIQKNQIKQLRIQMKNKEKQFKELLQKQRKKIQQSQSVHNMQTIKQLYIKTIQSLISLDQEKHKNKRQQKRKQIQQFFKIFSSLTKVQQKYRNKLLQSIKKLKINSVAPNHSRNSSSEKQ